MRFALILSMALTFFGAVEILGAKVTSAVQLRDGKVYFKQPPRLLRAVTTFKNVNVWGATYYFTIKLPPNAGEPLQKVKINQHEGLDRINFDLDDSFAFIGNTSNRGEKLSLDVTSDRKLKTVSLKFNPPVSPGETVTIALKPNRNPGTEGIYLFGVTAFPRGDNPHGQFLGFGRFHFYGDGFGLRSYPLLVSKSASK
ncbi:MAG: DUF2808 domain-containing protein [Mastigocoleus sp. MO_167.B18]|uniref:DUF2808 domain-containing protein n=1 Tax=Mastigocoleus sp. MO_188.B34 TaxID=3036635 RepID=UPI0026245FAB|nr:DUF2808 domain-containing protein [Mastigocoleus sp. MO_188.B34]MDJ0697566.1 DUF2808 domain-containing protein [Mastigocoleus sp. MO_188.B34]MDJ0774676.1 DUF2808 domain-containing protein [Mastigocoleus sp. MO_167.B18]